MEIVEDTTSSLGISSVLELPSNALSKFSTIGRYVYTPLLTLYAVASCYRRKSSQTFRGFPFSLHATDEHVVKRPFFALMHGDNVFEVRLLM